MTQPLLDQVRAHYAAAALAVASSTQPTCCGGEAGEPTCCGEGAALHDDEAGESSCCGESAAFYDDDEAADLPRAALRASLGCGNPTAVVDLREGERVLDLGSGGGIDVLLSARRVGPGGVAYGVDMTPEMIELARRNAAEAGVPNAVFLEGRIEELPLPDASVDVVVSNCVVNLSVDKPAVLAEIWRVLAPGGRVGISDVVAEDRLSPAERAERGSFAGCMAGALSRTEYLEGLAAAGFAEASVTFTHEVVDGLHGAIVRATRPA